MRILKTIGILFGCLTITLPAMAPAAAATQNNRAGKSTGHAKANVNKPAKRAGGNYKAPKVSNQQAYKAGKATNNKPKRGGNNVVAGNTVVVGQRPGSSGYYDNGRYYDRDRYDDDDNDFLEFVGKTAAITAGASVVAAVIGSSTNEKPDGCQPVNSYGNSYMYCNGTYYQMVNQNGQTAYTVVAPPQ